MYLKIVEECYSAFGKKNTKGKFTLKKLLNFSFYQGISIPLWGAALIIVGLLAPGHDSISQHLSTISLYSSPWPLVLQIISICLGLSVCVYSIGASYILKRFAWFSIPSLAFGVAMIFNGLYKMGSPLHGLYGMAFFSPLVPIIFALEFKERLNSYTFQVYSIITAILGMIYMWLMLTQFDPHGYIGLTQRIFILLMTVWYGVSIYKSCGNAHQREA
ncbi:DUF998 domain-containing protein [Kangiella sediminilitoris]|uniref:Putative transmembrane protein n=1 Tax=Kangiella sediminilitoris TaxID=1144748 RepID=A0A1B3BDN4_9GAMM|nr:Putative transmembrane protein [Kangiella sediminilitoris]